MGVFLCTSLDVFCGDLFCCHWSTEDTRACVWEDILRSDGRRGEISSDLKSWGEGLLGVGVGVGDRVWIGLGVVRDAVGVVRFLRNILD